MNISLKPLEKLSNIHEALPKNKAKLMCDNFFQLSITTSGEQIIRAITCFSHVLMIS